VVGRRLEMLPGPARDLEAPARVDAPDRQREERVDRELGDVARRLALHLEERRVRERAEVDKAGELVRAVARRVALHEVARPAAEPASERPVVLLQIEIEREV